MEKNLDSKGRWRNKLVGFRVSEEEAKLIDDCVSLSGLTKQDYIIRRLQCRDVVVQGNPRVYKEANDELLYTIQLIAETMNGLKGECPLLAESSSHFPSENKEDTE